MDKIAAVNWSSGSVQDYGTKGPEFESRLRYNPLRGVEYLLEYPGAGHLGITLFGKTRSCFEAETHPRFSGIRGWIL